MVKRRIGCSSAKQNYIQFCWILVVMVQAGG